MATTLAVLSQKGGTGKTTTVRHLTDAFARVGLKTLAIDLDPQGSLSDYFDVPPEATPTISEVLTGGAKAADAVVKGEGDLIPANLILAEAELALAGKIGREMTLKRTLKDLKNEYDFVLIDCPPTLGLLTVNALVAADQAIITTEAQYFSLQGVEQALEVIGIAEDSLNPELELLGIVLNIADMRLIHAREALASLNERFPGKVFDTVIRQSVRYAESAERGVSIIDYRPELGADYLNLAQEVLGRAGKADAKKAVGRLIAA